MVFEEIAGINNEKSQVILKEAQQYIARKKSNQVDSAQIRAIKGLIRQEETTPQLKVKGPDSEFAFDNDAIQIGVDAWRGADYGMWQRSCYVTLI